MASREKLVEAFKEFDKDGNGFITADELKKVLAELQVDVSDEEINEVLKVVDQNGDGKINIDEFIAVFSDK
jgi:calmodulin